MAEGKKSDASDSKTGDINNKKEKSDASDAKKTDTDNSNFDVSKLGDEDFQKVFDDPRLWQHSRFKELTQRAKKADQYETEQKKLEEKKLKEEKKYEELVEKLEKEREEAQEKFRQSVIDMNIMQAAAKQGAVDQDAVVKLIDRSKVSLDDNGNVAGVDEAIGELKESRKYLFGDPGSTTLGSATNPGKGGTDQPKRFKHSQIQDPVFYRENEQDILEAMKTGNIEDDLYGTTTPGPQK
jgi:hypothetical protein